MKNIIMFSPEQSIKYKYGLSTLVLWYLICTPTTFAWIMISMVLNLDVDWFYGSGISFSVIWFVTFFPATYITSLKLKKDTLFKNDTKKILLFNTGSLALPLLLFGISVGAVDAHIVAITGGYYVLASLFTTGKVSLFS